MNKDPKAPQVSNIHDLRAQCFQYIQERAASSLADPARFEKFNRSFNDEKNENRTVVETFLDQVDRRCLLIYYQSSDRVVATLEIPKQIKRKAVYFLKSNNVTDPIRKVEELKQEVVCGELSEAVLQSLSLLSHEVVYPLLSNPANRADWSGPTSKEVMLKFSSFLANLHMAVGQSKGQTLLPPPPPEAFDEDSIPQVFSSRAGGASLCTFTRWIVSRRRSACTCLRLVSSSGIPRFNRCSTQTPRIRSSKASNRTRWTRLTFGRPRLGISPLFMSS